MAKALTKQHSSYWLGDNVDLLDLSRKGDSVAEALKLVTMKRSVANFVRIVTGESYPVVFSSGQKSFTDGKTVWLSASASDKNFDSLVGVSLHEASHILLSDFAAVALWGNYNKNIAPQEDQDLYRSKFVVDGAGTPTMSRSIHRYVKLFHTLFNIFEDRRIDYYIYRTAPGYRPYYEAMYDRYFRSKQIDIALREQRVRVPTVENYLFHLINMANPLFDTRVLPGLDEIYGLIGLGTLNRLDKDPAYDGLAEVVAKAYQANGIVAQDDLPEMWKMIFKVARIIMENSDSWNFESDDPPRPDGEGESCEDGEAGDESGGESEGGESGESDEGSEPGEDSESSEGSESAGDSGEIDENAEDNYDNMAGGGFGPSDESESDGDDSGSGAGDETGDEEDSDSESDGSGEDSDGDEDSDSDSGESGSDSDGEEDSDSDSADGGDEGSDSDSETEDGDGDSEGDESTARDKFADEDSKAGKGKFKESSFDKARQNQGKFLDGEVRKTKISKNMKDLTRGLDSAGAEIYDTEVNTNWGGTEKIQVIVLKKFDSDQVHMGTTPFTSDGAYRWNPGRHRRARRYHYNPPATSGWIDKPGRNSDGNRTVETGFRMGRILASKLAIRNQSTTRKYNRRPDGKIDKRRLAGIGAGDQSVFYHVRKTAYEPVYLHMSIDFSGSMSGEKLNNALALAISVAVAADKIDNLEVEISARASVEKFAVIQTIYDSRVDKPTKIRSLFPYLDVVGFTPEGLCFEAIKAEVIRSAGKKDAYFVNLSDGAPYYESYSGEYAYDHTRKQVNHLRAAGLKVLSYYIEDTGGYSYGSDQAAFRKMYGKGAVFIDPKSVPAIAKTLNKLFLD